jgi:hypothetical protein
MKWWLWFVLLVPVTVEGADTKYIWTNPAFQPFQHPDSCGVEDSIPETGLSHVLMELIRLDDPDTLDLGQKPLTGISDSVLVSTSDSVWVRVFRVKTVDLAGNQSCGWTSHLTVTPVTEWPPSSAPPGLLAQYFDDMNLSVPYGQRVDPNIDFDWDASAPLPGMGVETFSARWTGVLTVPVTGQYQFRARVEDAVRLWIDGTQWMDDWVPQSEHNVTATVPLAQGSRPFRLDYFARNGNAAMRLFWTPPQGTEAVVPASAFSH